MYYCTSRTLITFEKYEYLAAQYVEYAYVPSTKENPVRQQVDRLLGESLANELPTAVRLDHAHEGMGLLKIMGEQVDRIGDKGEEVDVALSNFEKASSRIGALPLRSAAREITELAHKRTEHVRDVRGLSYRANYHVGEIFERIIRDNGVLTREHVLELNSQLPTLEEQFNRRTNTLTELQNAGVLIDNDRDMMFDGLWGWIFRVVRS
jgi:hypothetical protein